MRVSVVIPTLNEAGSIGRVLDDIPASLVAEVLVVDGGSTDDTREIAASRGACVILEPRRGYGRACLTGIERATDADVVVFLDGDYSDRPAELPRLLEPILGGKADVVLGSRLQGDLAASAMPWHQLLGNRFAAALIRALYGVRLTDLGPFRAARRDVLRALALREPTYGWAVELPTRGARRGYRVAEVPVSYHPRIGVSKISGTIRGTVGAAWCILTGVVLNRLRAEPRASEATGGMSALRSGRAGRQASAIRRALVVMAKAPRVGHAKTRLDAAMPAGDVVRLSECMLRDTVDLARSLDAVHVAIMCPKEDAAALAVTLPGVEVVAQEGVGLAAALTSAFRHFVAAGFFRVIAIDADSPHLPAAVIEGAFASLDERDLVVGPTEDGGYYLVGASAAHPGLFDAALGTSNAYGAFCANALSRGLSVAVARVWYDVDVAADLLRLAEDLRSEPARAPRTAAFFASSDALRGRRAGS